MCKHALTLQQEITELRHEVRALKLRVEQLLALTVELQGVVKEQDNASETRQSLQP